MLVSPGMWIGRRSGPFEQVRTVDSEPVASILAVAMGVDLELELTERELLRE